MVITVMPNRIDYNNINIAFKWGATLSPSTIREFVFTLGPRKTKGLLKYLTTWSEIQNIKEKFLEKR